MRFAALVALTAACGDDGSTPMDARVDSPDTCGCAYLNASVSGTVSVAGATELSGLVSSRVIPNRLWTHNDSGDTARVFAMTLTGSSVATLTLPNVTATDWEDIAVGPCANGQCIYIADIGDNDMNRASVKIHEVDEPADVTGSVVTNPRTWTLSYPDGPHNAEALIIDPRDRESYVITKQPTNPSKVFRMPRPTGGQATAVEVGTLTVPSGNPLVTGADLYADSCSLRMLVRTAGGLFEATGDRGATIEQLLAEPLKPVPVGVEQQGEAVTYALDGRGYYTVGEGDSQPIWKVGCP